MKMNKDSLALVFRNLLMLAEYFLFTELLSLGHFDVLLVIGVVLSFDNLALLHRCLCLLFDLK